MFFLLLTKMICYVKPFGPSHSMKTLHKNVRFLFTLWSASKMALLVPFRCSLTMSFNTKETWNNLHLHLRAVFFFLFHLFIIITSNFHLFQPMCCILNIYMQDHPVDCLWHLDSWGQKMWRGQNRQTLPAPKTYCNLTWFVDNNNRTW